MSPFLSHEQGCGSLVLAILLSLCVAVGPAGCGRRSHELASQAALAPPPPPLVASNSPWLVDATTEAGIDFTYRNGAESDRSTLLETVGGGVGLIDFDNDGWLDIVLPGGGGFSDAEPAAIHGHPTRLFRNLGNGSFEAVDGAFPAPGFYTHGCAVADYDRDGWPDVLLTGYARLALYRNEDDGRGGRHFVEVTERTGLANRLWSTSAAWGDLDGDGYADLYVCNYVDWTLQGDPFCRRIDGQAGRDVCPPDRFPPVADVLYLNNGDGRFRDATREQSLRGDGRGLGVVLVDVDDNGQPDVYVANDVTPNFLYVNRDGQLGECGELVGAALDENGLADGSMGVDAGDYDGNGYPDLWVTNFQHEVHALYANLGQGTFQHDSRAAGIAALGRQYVGFGSAFGDLDNDGWEDLLIVNGHVRRYPAGASFRQRGVMLHNVAQRGRRFYQDVSAQGGAYFQEPRLGRGLAIGDLENDGWPDVVVSHCNSPAVLLRNAATPKETNRWLGIELIGRERRDVTGSTLTLEVANRRLVRFVKGGGSYLSSGDRRLLFGLGPSDRVGRLSVRWSWGATEHWDGLEPNRYYVIREGDPTPVAKTFRRGG